jgi:hypothetical protein
MNYMGLDMMGVGAVLMYLLSCILWVFWQSDICDVMCSRRLYCNACDLPVT